LWDQGSSFSLTGGRPTFGVFGGVELELPFGGGRYSADAARAETELEAAEARQRVLLGTTTPQNVVSAEQTLREAELRRLRALVNQLSARFELEHTTGTLLERFASLQSRSSS
jgi:outer membrane protein TolC